jgi:hypothetical protein
MFIRIKITCETKYIPITSDMSSTIKLEDPALAKKWNTFSVAMAEFRVGGRVHGQRKTLS